ncbi:MAG TPA: tetratricopeptide repeat protein [Mariprofundaceae bacterium]|nr:tetratricopeptide repeat protein [Mariprofundaceae bacterium]
MEKQAYEHLKNSEWTEARRAFENELIIHPKNLEARYNLALLLQRAGHHDEELKLYQQNMELGWHLPTVVNLSAVYVARNKISQARALLEAATKRFRHEATPRYLLAELNEKDGKIAQARKWHEKALRADPLNGFAHVRYARFLGQQRSLDLALKHALKATRLQPTSAYCLAITGNIQIQRKEYSDALESYQKSLAIQPNPEIRQKLIDALHLMGRHERAERMQHALDAWIKHQPS